MARKMSQATANDDALSITRASLLDRLKDLGDREAWQDFFDTYWGVIFHFAKRTGLDEAEAEDVVIETVTVVARKIEEFKYERERGRFKTWLLTIARHRIGDRFKKRARRDQHGGTIPLESLPEGTLPEPRPSELERLWDEEWQTRLIDMTLKAVKKHVGARQFQIFHSYVIQENSAADVAAFYNISRGQVYMAKNRVGKIFELEYKTLAQQP